MRKTWLIFSQAVTVAVAVLFVVATLKPDWLQRRAGSANPVPVLLPSEPVATNPGGAGVVTGAASYAAAAKRAAPAVVSIVTSKSASSRHPRGDDPWFRYFFGEQSPSPGGIGSGVIVSANGYVLTNNHVIDGMDGIEVALSDGRRAKAEVIGADPEADLAVLRIALDKLPVVAFGDSDALQVGDVVLAIGNPFGVGQTVTAGIVSALGRNSLGINTFENFIQTDAAINPGNSGGALVDAAGSLMGVNTAIYSRSGGNLGIGFAIPATTARQVMDALIRDGQVTRGWIGVEPRELTPEIAETFKLPATRGVLITGVLQGGPAGEAGLKPGDVVQRVGEERVDNTAQLLNAVAALKPKSKASLGVQRGERELELEVLVAQRPKQLQAQARDQ
ncbi:MAG TPA: trypsin-like peptidase domain-containing protein [Methylibium sp.]|uniref:S1C family serine protease n=1 Tax=Methylibium sp. TaxID=2067992 RepID=UPI002DBAE025|nr:trypsin-like peptidase domain-containing protein [Methylibium sp.]HEU4459307.1 trypsin-like peptidase domain-containing protein [Methylibium sp.]